MVFFESTDPEKDEYEIHKDFLIIAAVAEMIHTASLIVDDIIDSAETRRAIPATWQRFGQRATLDASNLIVAQSMRLLTNISQGHKQLEILSLLTTMIGNLVQGEVKQFVSANNPLRKRSIQRYLDVCYLKTASMFANTCRSVAILSARQYPDPAIEASYIFGKSIGIAFQIADDILDFGSSVADIGISFEVKKFSHQLYGG